MFAEPVVTHALRLPGPWHYGAALDYYTYYSIGWRPPLGVLISDYKYGCGDPGPALDTIIATLDRFVRTRLPVAIDLVTCVPNAANRSYARSTDHLADRLARKLGVPAVQAISTSRNKQSVKNVPLNERHSLVRGQFTPQESAQSLRGRAVLLLDDVYETGSTMREAYRVLRSYAAPRQVIAVAVTHIWAKY